MSDFEQRIGRDGERSLDKYRVVSVVSKFISFALFALGTVFLIVYTNSTKFTVPYKKSITNQIQIPVSLRERVDDSRIDPDRLWMKINRSELRTFLDLKSLPNNINKYYSKATPTEAKIIDALICPRFHGQFKQRF